MFATSSRACAISFYRSSNFLFETGISIFPTSASIPSRDLIRAPRNSVINNRPEIGGRTCTIHDGHANASLKWLHARLATKINLMECKTMQITENIFSILSVRNSFYSDNMRIHKSKSSILILLSIRIIYLSLCI